MVGKFRFYHSKLNCVFEVVSISFLSEKVECIVSDVDNYLNTWRWSYGELLQSTGLKGRNGVEIFEGDVVKTKLGEHGRHIGVVTFRSGKFISKGVKQYEGYVEELNGTFEVIGNKFEHPHLLKE